MRLAGRLTLAGAVLCLAAALASVPVQAQLPQPQAVSARAWMLYDQTTGQVLAEHDADLQVEPASVGQLMSAYVVLGALKADRVRLTASVRPSVRAAQMPAPSMHLEAGTAVGVQDLLAAVAVISANDAMVALADAVAGSEAAFVAMMNLEARHLGLTATSFRNATGLHAPGQASTARDLTRLSAALMRDHPAQYALFGRRSISYRGLEQDNHNRLLWLDPTVDGVTAGQTGSSGWNIVASALRGKRRLIAVLLGTSDETANIQEALRLLNFGYQAYDSVRLYPARTMVKVLDVWKGTQSAVKAGFLEDLIVAVPRGQAGALRVEMRAMQPLMAPLRRGERVGTVSVRLGEVSLGDYPLLALDEVPIAGWLRRGWDALRLWLK